MTYMYRGLKNHIIKTGLIPILALSLTLSVLTTILALYQSQAAFEEQVRISASQINLLTSAAVEMGNPDAIQKVARASLQKSGLQGVRISNRDGDVVYQAGPPFQSQNLPESPVLRPPYLDRDNLILITSQLSRTNPAEPGLWLELEFNHSATLLNQYQWVLLGTLTGTLCLLLATVVSLRLANSITTPLERITTAISQVNMSDLSARIPTSHNVRLDILSRNINALLAKMQISYREMRDEVDMVADELQKNMETLELNNAELDLSRKRAIQANESKSAFLANMSHEMRTPLNSISGYAELLMRSRLEDSQKEHLRTLTNAADSLLAIIDDILDFAKLEAGKLVLEHTPLNLRTVIDEVLAMNNPSAEKKHLELAAIIPTDVPVYLIGDANRLKQILSNLISNAIKFTNSGSVITQVHCDKQSETHATLRISVEDTGIGIQQQDARKLFKAFSQVDTSRSRNSQGTGLGLVICKSLVEQMQGSIDFDSQPGKGTRFWFTLRLPVNSQQPPVDYSPTDICGRTAVLIEPKPWSRKSITQLLYHEGYQIQVADNLLGATQFIDMLPSLVVLGYRPESMPALSSCLENIPSYFSVLILTVVGQLEPLSRQVDPSRMMLMTYPLSQKRLQEALARLYPAEQTQRLQPQSNNSPDTWAGLRILAVDDNEPNRRLLQTILTDIGITTDTAASGQEALEKINTHTYNMVFMDIQMPEMDGLETTRRIRSAETEGQHLPVIALTAHALAQEKKELIQAGMNDYLTKPVSEQQLLHTISYWATNVQTQETQLTPTVQPTLPLVDNSSPVNKEEGIQLAGGREDLAEELLGMLLDSLENTREGLLNHQHLGNSEALLAEVHKLHGAARYCGTPPLRHACQELELQLKQNRQNAAGMTGTEELFTDLLEEIDRLLVWRELYAPEIAAPA